MDGSDRLVRRKSLKERLGFTGIGCCGASWQPRPSSTSGNTSLTIDDDEDEEVVINMEPTTPDIESTPIGSTPLVECLTPGRSGMNLADALAAERQYRTARDTAEISFGVDTGPIEGPIEAISTSRKVSLMILLKETDGCDEKEEGKVVVGNDSVCCVCMVRKKGAAFIPCGHTFCRVCSRELWLNRGSCPLCNRSIFEILDIF